MVLNVILAILVLSIIVIVHEFGHFIIAKANGITVVDPFYQSAPELVFYTNGEVSDIMDVSTLKTKDDIIKVLKERSVIND